MENWPLKYGGYKVGPQMQSVPLAVGEDPGSVRLLAESGSLMGTFVMWCWVLDHPLNNIKSSFTCGNQHFLSVISGWRGWYIQGKNMQRGMQNRGRGRCRNAARWEEKAGCAACQCQQQFTPTSTRAPAVVASDMPNWCLSLLRCLHSSLHQFFYKIFFSWPKYLVACNFCNRFFFFQTKIRSFNALLLWFKLSSFKTP